MLDKKSSILVLYVDPVTATYEVFCKWVEHPLDSTLGTKPQNIAPAVAGPPQMNAAFWGNTTKMLATSIVSLQYQHSNQHHPGSTQSFHKGSRDKYKYYALDSLMGYSNVFNTSDIPINWVKFQHFKELSYNRHEFKKGMERWSRMKLITIGKSVHFIIMNIEDMINIMFMLGGSVSIFERAENGITPLIVLPWGA